MLSTTDCLKYSALDLGIHRWAAVRTGARWEKRLADALNSLKIPVFLPMIETKKKYKTRINTAQIPLFSGYLFFAEDFISRMRELSPDSKRFVAQVIKPPESLVLYNELLTVSNFLQNSKVVQEQIYGKEGEVVVIKAGPFSDHIGVIKKVNAHKKKVTLSVSYLGLAVEVELDAVHTTRP